MFRDDRVIVEIKKEVDAMELDEFVEMLSEEEYYMFEESAESMADAHGVSDEEARIMVMNVTLKLDRKIDTLVMAK